VGAQSWNLYPRIREIDAVLTAGLSCRRVMYEAHPELSFMMMNGGVPIGAPKRSPEGRERRFRLIEAHFGRDEPDFARREHPTRLAADDDILDAFAVLWMAGRIQEGRARVIPDPPEMDERGIAMGVWC
jgi:predicted RNase H-like nuclease